MPTPPIAADGMEWCLTVVAVAQGCNARNAGTQCYRLRVRTAHGEKAVDVTRAELPARIAELCARLGLEGEIMSDGLDLGALRKARTARLAEIDREIAEREQEFEAQLAELRQQRKRLLLEERELAKALARVEAGLARGGGPKSGGETSAKMRASWTPERRAKMAEAMRRRNEEKRAAKAKRGGRASAGAR